MDFTLKNNGLVTESIKNEIENDITKLAADIENLNSQLDEIDTAITRVEANLADQKVKTTALVAAIDSMLVKATETDKTIADFSTLINTKKLTAENASIQETVISKANITDLNVTNPITADIDNNSITTKALSAENISAAEAEIKGITADNITVNNTLNIDKLATTEVNASTLISANSTTDTITVTDKMVFNGIDIKSIDIKASGIDNMHLHKLVIKADGTLIIKLVSSSIIVSASNVTSNYDGLYASYIENGHVVLYISQDIDCQALVIGDAEIKVSTVLKTSVRRNADSNGNPNLENTVKVAVVDKLPTIGQRNIIYIVLGDCAYYCDGQYFYEMAAKKRG